MPVLEEKSLEQQHLEDLERLKQFCPLHIPLQGLCSVITYRLHSLFCGSLRTLMILY